MKRFYLLVLMVGFEAHADCQTCKVGDFPVELPWEAKNLPVIDKGTLGHTFEITEEDLLKVIEGKLKKWEGEGRLASLNRDIQERAMKSMERPKPVKGLQKAEAKRRFTFDPTFTVEEDVRDHQGTLIHKKGTKINPLHHLSFGEPLIFLDGDDAEQVLAFKGVQGKIVLVKGSPIEVSKTMGDTVYFDQGGSLVQKFGIKRLPSRVFQEGDVLVIEEGPV